MKIKGLTNVSLVDWDGEVCSTIFLGGCNFRCPWCQNASLVLNGQKTETFSMQNIIKQINDNKDYITGVCITGGEPTLSKKLVDLCINIPPSLKIKVDTNGTCPDVINGLTPGVDYIAMDIKAPLTFQKYSKVVGRKVSEDDLERIASSIDVIRKYAKDYEFRTTVIPGFHTVKDIEEICKYAIKGAKRYVIQNFWNGGDFINPNFSKIKPFSQGELETFAEIARKYVNEVKIRNLSQ